MKIKLGNRPKNFKRIVTFDMLEGGKGSIECTFKYRTRSEFGRFLDEKINVAHSVIEEAEKDIAQIEKSDIEASDSANVKAKAYAFQEKLQDETSRTNADYLFNILDGWNLDEEFCLDSLKQLCDELPAAAAAIMETYRTACVEGRLGN